MSMHKLTAGAGYDYLTRQVAALDGTEKGHTGLASYYTERGETPGTWTGSGLEGIDGLTADDPVTAEQMRALFGCGLHPLAELRQQQLEGPDLTERDYQDAARLGAPFKIVDGDVSPFRLEVAKRIGAIQAAAGLPTGAALPASDRGLPVSTTYDWRTHAKRRAAYRFGKHLKFAVSDVRAWVAEQRETA